MDFAASKQLEGDAFARFARAFVEQLSRPMCEITHLKEWLMAQLLVLSRWSGKSAPSPEAGDVATIEVRDGVITVDSHDEVADTAGIGVGAAFVLANQCLLASSIFRRRRSVCN